MGSNAVAVLAGRCGAAALRRQQLLSRISPPRRRAASSRAVVRLPRIALDIDNPEDLARCSWQRRRSTPARARLLDRWDCAPTRRRCSERASRMNWRGSASSAPIAGEAPSRDDAMALADCDDLDALMARAAALRDDGHGARVSYSRKVFIPLTQLCRDVCHYCTFAHPPRRGERRLSDARRGAGDRARRRARPAARRRCSRSATSRSCATARRARNSRGSATTARSPISPRMAALVLRRDRAAAASQSGRDDRGRDRAAARASRCRRASCWRRAPSGCRGAAARISARPTSMPARAARDDRGGRRSARAVHLRHPDRHRRNARGAHRGAAGAARPARALRPHAGNHHPEFPRQARTRGWRSAPEPALDEHLWTIAVARMLFGAGDEHPGAAQSRAGALQRLIAAGINDWGGVSPVTPDHVNPEAPWPQLDAARARDRATPARCWSSGSRSIRPTCSAGIALDRAGAADARCCAMADAEGFARTEAWTPGAEPLPPPPMPRHRSAPPDCLTPILDRAMRGPRA